MTPFGFSGRRQLTRILSGDMAKALIAAGASGTERETEISKHGSNEDGQLKKPRDKMCSRNGDQLKATRLGTQVTISI